MAKKTRKTKFEKLLLHLQKAGKKGLTHKQIVQFLLRGTGRRYDRDSRKIFDSSLYGTSTRAGILYDRAERNEKTGNWYLANKPNLTGPFTPKFPDFAAWPPLALDEPNF